MMPSTTTQPQGGNPGLAALFRNNAPVAPGAMPQQLPQIMAPTTPNIGMPPRQQMPVQNTAHVQAPPAFQSINQLLSYMHTNPGKVSPEVANSYKSVLKTPWGR